MDTATIHEFDNPTVVIVEGSPESPPLLHLFLEQAGFQTIATTDFEVARMAGRGDRLLILDLSRPDAEGADTCRRLLLSGAHPDAVLLVDESDLPGLPPNTPVFIQPFHPLNVVTRLITMLRRRMETGPAA